MVPISAMVDIRSLCADAGRVGMYPYSPAERPGRATKLTGRESERNVLDRLVEAVRAGSSRGLVIHGDPGVGKTVLLDALGGRAHVCRLSRSAGVQSHL